LQRHSIVAWARRIGMTPRQARYAVSKGELDRLQIPVGGRLERSPNGRLEILVPWNRPRGARRAAALYARAWRHGAQDVLSQQLTALQAWAAREDFDVLATVSEMAGPFDFPEKLLGLVIDPTIPLIVVANKDVLGWLNAPFLTAILESQGRELLDLGMVESCVREEWSALNDLQRVARQMLRGLHHAIEVQLPLPHDPPPPPLTSPLP
jgi:predicted site-specific integrase-resolvase